MIDRWHAAPKAQSEPDQWLAKAIALGTDLSAAMLALGHCPENRRAEMQAWADEAREALAAHCRAKAEVEVLQGLLREHLGVIRFALHRFMWDAHHRSVEAAQDKDNKHYKPGDFEAFDNDRKKAEAALAAIAALKDKP